MLIHSYWRSAVLLRNGIVYKSLQSTLPHRYSRTNRPLKSSQLIHINTSQNCKSNGDLNLDWHQPQHLRKSLFTPNPYHCNIIMAHFALAIAIFFYLSATCVTALTPRFKPGSIARIPSPTPLAANTLWSLTPPAEGACDCTRAIKLSKRPLPIGSLAMLHVANKHARSMAAKRRLYQPPIRAINSHKELPCGTYLSGASVARATGTDIGSTCADLWRSSVRGTRHLHVVIGSHRSSNGVVWCVALFGMRTKFGASGECARVSCYWNGGVGLPENANSASNKIPIRTATTAHKAVTNSNRHL